MGKIIEAVNIPFLHQKVKKSQIKNNYIRTGMKR